MSSIPPGVYAYWAKARRHGPGAPFPPHLCIYHSLDAAAVCDTILQRHPRLSAQLSESLGIASESLRAHLALRVGLHDCGKLAGGFQHQAPALVAALGSPALPRPYPPNHVELGAMAWQRWLIPRWGERFASRGGWTADDWCDYLSAWDSPFTGHHGQPPRLGDYPPSRADVFWDPPGKQTLLDFEEVLSHLLGADQPPALTSDDVDALIASSKGATWRLAGLVVLCDWIASNETFFPLRRDVVPLEEYWTTEAVRRARDAVQRARVLPQHVRTSALSMLLGARPPTPLQRAVAALEPSGEGALYILEDATGSGKTEAALHLASRVGAGLAAGLYFGLPTQATATAMHDRAASWSSVFFGEHTDATQALIHGEAYVVQAPDLESGRIPLLAEDGGQSATEWLQDSRKRALLAGVGIGTIDQALLGMLPVRHQALRLYALAERILIIDEVHAYDDYTFSLIERLVEHQARAGMPTIVLSATLPIRHRNRLLKARALGRGTSPDYSVHSEFPLLLSAEDRGVTATFIEPAPWTTRDVPVELVQAPEEAQRKVEDAISDGACVCWIRNTIDDAIEAADELDHLAPLVLHSRYLTSDRARLETTLKSRAGPKSTADKRRALLVVATQVVEQSLDLDFDLIVTDLAPMDSVLQRAGRMRRHTRDAAGNPAAQEARPVRTLLVHSPPANATAGPDWCSRWSAGTSAVYPDTARLWLTASRLQELKSLQLPLMARGLVESVYGDDATDLLPPALKKVALEQEGRRTGERSTATLAALSLQDGYSPGGRWEDEANLRTRLGEAQHDVYLALRRDEGVVPFASGAWAGSRLRIRAGIAPHRPAAETEPALALQLPDRGRLSRIVVLDAEGRAAIELPTGDTIDYEYSRTRGLRIQRRKA